MAAWVSPKPDPTPPSCPAPARSGLDFPLGFTEHLLPSAPLDVRLAELRPQARFVREPRIRRIFRSP